MSELIQHSEQRKALLKHMIMQLHRGEAPEEVRKRLVELLGKIPYDEVVAVEQELIAEGMPEAEVIKMCDVHAEALKGQIEKPLAAPLPAGHPLRTLQEENKALMWEVRGAKDKIRQGTQADEKAELTEMLNDIRLHFYRLLDVDKHYARKEYLLFPHLEQHAITGPSTVMWGKDDEAREKLKAAVVALDSAKTLSPQELAGLAELLLDPALTAIEDMVLKEEDILFPMCREKFSDEEWYAIYQRSPAIGFCLYEPKKEWKPKLEKTAPPISETEPEKINIPSGSFTPEELTAILNTIPFDITFVDSSDRVRYFSEGKERIFERNRSILGREVRRCHPPKSLHVVERIIDDFKNGRQDHAAFWITLNGRFIHIEYFALRNPAGKYLGVLEVSQDLTDKRALTGERRLLQYEG